MPVLWYMQASLLFAIVDEDECYPVIRLSRTLTIPMKGGQLTCYKNGMDSY